MLGVLMLFLMSSTICATGVLGEPSPYETEPNCKDVSKDVDNWIFKSNYIITTGGDDTLDIDGFETTIRPYFLGIPLPVQVHMEVQGGQLHSMDGFTRISPVSKCVNTTSSNYTTGLYQYKDMKITYQQFTAKVLFWEIQGKFTYELEPEVNVIVRKSDDPLDNDCGPLRPLTLTSSGPNSYEIETDDSWKSWFLKKVLHRALVGDDNTPMLQMFLDRAWVSIDCYYCRYSCEFM